eukprot:PhF_6_TR5630/c0_g1_i5/m.8184
MPSPVSPAYSLVICTVFCFTSAWSTVYNKYLMDGVLPSSNALLLYQNIGTLIFLTTAKSLGCIHYEVSLRNAGDWGIGILYSVNVVAGMGSLLFVSVPMFGALKRLTVAVSWGIEYIYTYN